MATRKRIDHHEGNRVSNSLHGVLKCTIEFMKAPITEEEMLKVWHAEIPEEILAAHRLIQNAGYGDQHSFATHRETFVVPSKKLGIRFSLDSRHGPGFLNTPTEGPHEMVMMKYGYNHMRVVTEQAFSLVLGPERAEEFWDWAKMAAATSDKHTEAKQTIHDIVKMISTAGQVRRMVPQLVEYLHPVMQQELAAQTRASPFPEDWPTYDKTRVERLLTCLAEGHLLRGMAKQECDGHSFPWASTLPKQDTAVDVDP